MRMLALPILVIALGCASTVDTQVAGAAASADVNAPKQMGMAFSHYLASILYEQDGDFDKAISELRNAADLAPESVPLQIKLLIAYFQNRDYENAVTMAERAVHEEPDNVIWYIWLGRTHYQLEHYDAAIEAFQKAIAIDPDSSIGYEALVEIEEQTNDLVGAVSVYERLIEMRPDSAFLHYRLGLSLAKMSDDGARAEFERALELNPGLHQATYLLGVMLLESGDTAAAALRFHTFLRSNPDHVEARANLAAAQARLGIFKSAIRTLSKVLEKGALGSHQSTRLHIQRLALLLRAGEIADPSIAVAPSGAPFLGVLLQALVRKQAGEPYRELIASLDTIEGDLDFECTNYLNDLITLFGRDDMGAFLEERLIELRKSVPRSKVLETVQGRLLMSLDRDADAREVFLGILDAFGADKSLHYYLGTVAESLKLHDETEKHLRACLAIDPNDPDILNFLGYMFADINVNLDEAEELIEHALKIDPDNGFYLDSMGWLYYRKGKAEKAIELIKRAIRLMPNDDPILRDHLGDAYRLEGDCEAAIAEWKRAIRLDPKQEGIQEKIDQCLRRLPE